MAAPILLPLLIGVIILAVVTKKKPSSGAATGATTGGDEGADAIQVDVPIADGDVAGCIDPGLSGPLAAQVAAALSNPTALGPEALLELAAVVGAAAGPTAQACLKEAAEKLKKGTGGGGDAPFKVPSDLGGILGKVGEVLGAPLLGGMVPQQMTGLPTYPPVSAGGVTPNPKKPTSVFDTFLVTEAPGAPKPPFLLAQPGANQWAGAPHKIRSGDKPGMLAMYYTGDPANYHDLINQNIAASVGLTETGGLKPGELINLPAHWQPYSVPLPKPGTHDVPTTSFPPRPPVPWVPGVF